MMNDIYFYIIIVYIHFNLTTLHCMIVLSSPPVEKRKLSSPDQATLVICEECPFPITN